MSRLWICAILTIVVVWIIWNQPTWAREGFQAQAVTARGLSSLNSTQIPSVSSRFWDIKNKVDAGDTSTITALAKVSDPDPSDSKDLMPVSFSKHISIYSMARSNNDLSGARSNLFYAYDQLQTEMATNLYDQTKVAAWNSDAKAESCKQLDTIAANFAVQYALLKGSIQDLSGTTIKAASIRDENMDYQKQLLSKCQGTPLSPACISLANQEGPVFPLMAKYETVNNTLFSNELDISDNIQTINDTYSVVGCSNPNQFFSTGSGAPVFWVNNNTKYPVAACSACPTAISSNCSKPNIAPQGFFDKLTTGAAFACSMVTVTPLFFSGEQAGSIDTTVLRSKLNQLSPYYISPDTLQYITSSIISAEESASSVMTTSDTLINISKVIQNIRIITGTQAVGTGTGTVS
jgi:hypothetical protein